MEGQEALKSLEEVQGFGEVFKKHVLKFSDHRHYRKFVRDVIDAVTDGMDHRELQEVGDYIAHLVGHRADPEDSPAVVDFIDFM
jgi:hypothetical protein